MLQRITPFLWFDDQAEPAARFYTSIFRDSKIVTIARYGDVFRTRGPAIRRRQLPDTGGGLLTMKKLDIAASKRAFDGGA